MTVNVARSGGSIDKDMSRRIGHLCKAGVHTRITIGVGGASSRSDIDSGMWPAKSEEDLLQPFHHDVA